MSVDGSKGGSIRQLGSSKYSSVRPQEESPQREQEEQLNYT